MYFDHFFKPSCPFRTKHHCCDEIFVFSQDLRTLILTIVMNSRSFEDDQWEDTLLEGDEPRNKDPPPSFFALAGNAGA